ncbi:MAG TPA: hypothetical protein VF119_08685 [Candidatus Limnocylindrales bacterium]
MSAVSTIRARYPLGVIVVAGISLLRAITIVADLAEVGQDGVLGYIVRAGPLPDFKPGTDVHLVIQGVLVGLLLASTLIVIGLVLQKRWAWVLAIITSGVILAVDLGWWFAGEPRYSSMLMNAIAVFYLNQREVRLALRGGPPEP